jgi:hypothetical protein
MSVATHARVHAPAGYVELLDRINEYLDGQDDHDRARTLCLLTDELEIRKAAERRRLGTPVVRLRTT